MITRFIALFFCFAVWSCQNKLDLPQHIAGADTLELILRQPDRIDTIQIRHRHFIKKVVHNLTYLSVVPKTTFGYPIQFLRKSLKVNLWQGYISEDFRYVQFTYHNKLYYCEVGKPAQTILKQAIKYPTLLLKE